MNTAVEALVQRYVGESAALDEAQLDRLATALEGDPALVAELRAGLVVDELLAAVFGAERQGFTGRVLQARDLGSTRIFTRRVMDRTRRVDRRRRRVAQGGWLVAALLLVGVALLAVLRLQATRPLPAMPVVETASNAVPESATAGVGRIDHADRCRLRRDGAEGPLSAGMILRAGDRLLIDGSAILQAGASRLELAGDTDLTVQDGAHLRLTQGLAQVAVDHGTTAPTDGIRLHLATTCATAQVTGTRFAMAATAAWTRVRLAEGSLELSAAGSTSALHAGEEVVASATGLRCRPAEESRLVFALADADTDRLLPDHVRLADGGTLAHQLLTTARLVPRVLPAMPVTSMGMRLDGGDLRVEANPPWNVVRDRDGRHMRSGVWRPSPGWHLIETTAHARADATGPPVAETSLLIHVR